MVNPESLRVGNLILDSRTNDLVCVGYLTSDSIGVYPKGCKGVFHPIQFNQPYFRGIPLKESLFRQTCLGDLEWEVYLGHSLELIKRKDSIYFRSHYQVIRKVSFLHEVQNLFYSIVGEEIKLAIDF